FDPHEWIGKGKKYNTKTLPQSVLNARSATLIIPPAYIQQIPSPHLAVTDFLKVTLP
ncbi:hypothetical protein DFH29DRAFT_759349, partial [Suillus ampliporus]